MQGIFVREPNPVGRQLGWRRPKSKKEVRELVKSGNLDCVKVEATSLFGNEYGGLLSEAPTSADITWCGPDPYLKRSHYGNIKYGANGWAVT